MILHLLDEGSLAGLTADAAQRGIAFVRAMEPSMFRALGLIGATEWARKKEYAVQMLLSHKDGMTPRAFRAAIGYKCGKGEGEKIQKELLDDRIIKVDVDTKRLRVVQADVLPFRKEG